LKIIIKIRPTGKGDKMIYPNIKQNTAINPKREIIIINLFRLMTERGAIKAILNNLLKVYLLSPICLSWEEK
jgi:hypothetical protein